MITNVKMTTMTTQCPKLLTKELFTTHISLAIGSGQSTTVTPKDLIYDSNNTQSRAISKW